jgi:glycine/D-amino acid oxidase-like deaminating enzyme
MFDRKPIIGFHPEFNNIAVFGGLGTKGALWAPKLADLTKSLLLAEKPYIPHDISVSRWWLNT